MIWQFHGERFSLDIDAVGERTFWLDIAWHKPLLNMGGPAPELELDDVKALFARSMLVRLCSGGPERIIAEARDHAIVGGGIRLGDLEYQPRCMLTTCPDRASIEVTVALKAENFATVSDTLLAYATAPYPKCFGGSLHAQQLRIGSQRLKASNGEMRSFLAGERPAMTDEAPRLAFSFGTSLPDAPDFHDVLKDLGRQFD